jgi:hypothetical protein
MRPDLAPADILALQRLYLAGPLDEFDDAFGIRVPGLRGYHEFSEWVCKQAVYRLQARGLACIVAFAQHGGGRILYRAAPTQAGVAAIKSFGVIRDA